MRIIMEELVFMKQQIDDVYRARDQLSAVLREAVTRMEMAMRRMNFGWRGFLLSLGITDADLREPVTGFPPESSSDSSSSSVSFPLFSSDSLSCQVAPICPSSCRLTHQQSNGYTSQQSDTSFALE
jgi:hypothetical protein